jgi:hypothetical protein
MNFNFMETSFVGVPPYISTSRHMGMIPHAPGYYEHPVVVPHSKHTLQVPLRTMRAEPHDGQTSPV